MRRLPGRLPYSLLGPLLVSALALALFAAFSLALEGPGLPLDDGWIHQVYARNLVQTGTWSFQQGAASAGSTSPLWSLLQVPGHVMGILPPWWVLLLGWLCLSATAILASGNLAAEYNLKGWQQAAISLPFALEWHLVWAGLSGMETLAAGLLALMLLSQLERERPPSLGVGVLTGLGIWLRPDLLSLTGAVVVVWLFRLRRQPASGRWLIAWLGGVIAALAPYFVFQFAVGGSPWPTTFYAKQAEYAVLRQAPLAQRYLAQWQAPLAGVSSLLLPGILLWAVAVIRRGQWSKLAPLLWVLGYAALFAWRLPVTYQHGRYMMPAVPVLLWLGMKGFLRLMSGASGGRLPWILRRAWPAALALVVIIFLVVGARAYAVDVAIIETEMVRTSQWVSENTAETALVAAHDIGALGYFGNRAILDLAGLVSPEVIPIMRNEMALAEWMDRQGADYLMTFPEWYPTLSGTSELVFSSGGKFSPEQGGSNMALYRP